MTTTRKTPGDWTIAYRAPGAPFGYRVYDFAGNWLRAEALAAVAAQRNPGLLFSCMPTAAAEVAGLVDPADRANVRDADTGVRIPMADCGMLELIDISLDDDEVIEAVGEYELNWRANA